MPKPILALFTATAHIGPPGLLLSVLLLAACGAEIELPPAQPLQANAGQLAAIPNLERGDLKVQANTADLSVAGTNLRVRIVRPLGAGPFPLLLFSHGFASDGDKYDAVLEHWASHGYLSLAPSHADSGGTVRGIWSSIRLGKAGLIAARVADINGLLDNLASLDQLTPGLSQQIDPSRIVVAGHSFGAFTAQQFGGAAVIEPDSQQVIGGRDARVKAIVALSPPGEMFGLINDQSWRAMEAPMLATTGTWDMDGRFVTDWRQHRLSFDTARPGNNWLLIVAGADHYLGNLICRPERDAEPQTDALAMVNAAVVSFLNAELRGDTAAAEFLTRRRFQALTTGFATLHHR